MTHKSNGRSALSIALFLRQFSRRSILVLAAVVALAAAVAVSTIKPPVNAAVEAADVTWSPGDVTWEILQDGRCITTQSVEVTAKTNEAATELASKLQEVPRKTDFPADSGIQDAHANVGSPGNTTSIPVVLHTYLAKDKCETASTARALYDEQGGKLNNVQLAAAAAAAPKWLKGAIAAVVGAAVYIAVSTLVTAGITASGVLVGASAAVVAATTALSGCIGGASSTAVTLALAGAGTDWKSTLSNAMAGCLTGAGVALLPIKQVGTAAGNAIRAAFGAAPVATVGEGAVAAAAEAGIELNPIAEVVNHAADVAIAVE